MQIVIAALLAVYFLFCLNHIANGGFFSRIGAFQPNAYDLATLIFVLVTGGYFYLKSKRHPLQRMPRNEFFVTVVIFISLTFITLASHIYDPDDKSPAIALTVGFVATLGWIFTNYMNARHQTRAHTMNLLLSLRTNSVLNEHRINFFKRFPPGTTPFSDTDIPVLKAERSQANQYNITSSNRSTSTWDSIQYMANLYEFICVGMRQRDLDETIIKMSLRGILVHYSDVIRPFISDARRDEHGNLLPRVYENFLYYAEKWRNE